MIIAVRQKGEPMSRLIDGDALKEKAWDAKTQCGYVQVIDVGDIDDAPTIEPEPKWIPCDERLPDKEGNYLMTAQPTYNHAKDIRIAHWSGRWVGYVKSEILAWMPLPEPYREEGENR